jgi:hypothetical protein
MYNTTRRRTGCLLSVSIVYDNRVHWLAFSAPGWASFTMQVFVIKTLVVASRTLLASRVQAQEVSNTPYWFEEVRDINDTHRWNYRRYGVKLVFIQSGAICLHAGQLIIS